MKNPLLSLLVFTGMAVLATTVFAQERYTMQETDNGIIWLDPDELERSGVIRIIRVK